MAAWWRSRATTSWCSKATAMPACGHRGKRASRRRRSAFRRSPDTGVLATRDPTLFRHTRGTFLCLSALPEPAGSWGQTPRLVPNSGGQTLGVRVVTPEARVRPLRFGSVVVLMHHGVAFASGDQPAVRGPGRAEGDRATDDDAPPELRIAQARVQRARNDEDEAVVDRFHDCDRHRVRCEGHACGLPQ